MKFTKQKENIRIKNHDHCVSHGHDFLLLERLYLASTFVLNTNSAIATGVGLMLLGMAPYEPTHWSIMLSNASVQANSGMNTAGIFNTLVPTAAFVLLQMSLIFFANGLDEALNPSAIQVK